MENQIVKKEGQALANEDLMNEVRQTTGESRGNKMPYIPKIKVNNVKEKKIVPVNGKDTEVEMPIIKGFNITRYNENTKEYEKSYFKEELEAVILKIRWSLQSNMNVKPEYYSYEFNNFDESIKVFDREDKKEIFEGNYSEIKKHFATGEMNSMGKPKWSGSLTAIIYIHIPGTKPVEIYRLIGTSSCLGNLFEYKNTFGKNETHLGIKTKFPMTLEKNGKIEFYKMGFEKGESVNLEEEFSILQEINKYFQVVKHIRVKTEDYSQPEPKEDYPQVIKTPKEEDEINVDDIPF